MGRGRGREERKNGWSHWQDKERSNCAEKIGVALLLTPNTRSSATSSTPLSLSLTMFINVSTRTSNGLVQVLGNWKSPILMPKSLNSFNADQMCCFNLYEFQFTSQSISKLMETAPLIKLKCFLRQNKLNNAAECVWLVKSRNDKCSLF